MQMYEGLPIITNKIPENERNSIPHHLLGTVSLASEPWTVPKFVHESQRIIQEIRSRGRLPILVGGSHYYTQALLLSNTVDGVATNPHAHQTSQRTILSLASETPTVYLPSHEWDAERRLLVREPISVVQPVA